MRNRLQRFLTFSSLAPLMVLVGLGACQTKLPELPSLSLTRDTPAPVEQAPLRQARQLLPTSGMVTVGEGDSIFTLATRYQITPQSIINDNQLVPPFTIQPGEQLKLSPARYHIVVITDDLYSLSQRYAVSQEQLAALNDLQEPYELVVGQQLLLPEQPDFSVLDVAGIEIEVLPVTIVTPAPQAAKPAAPKALPKSFVAPALGNAGFTWPVKGGDSGRVWANGKRGA